MSQFKEGDLVVVDGHECRVLKVTAHHYGLVDDSREPMIDDENGQRVAHIAVRHDQAHPVPHVAAGPVAFGPDGFTVTP